MNCTGKVRREQICNDYNITPVGCYKLFGGLTMVSDAGGRKLCDKYYLFLCEHKTTMDKQKIICGYPTAKHLCNLSDQLLPSEFNPFQEEHVNDNNNNNGGYDDNEILQWHRSRRQLYNAIMIFITRYGKNLVPKSAIFRIKDSVESNVAEQVEINDVLGVNTIIKKYNTSIPTILEEFEMERAVRRFTFDELEQIINDRNIDYNCFV